MKIYNTYSRQLEDFKPIEPGKVKMYVCGPTVYNYIHVGNARSVVAFDLVRKYLEFRGFEVQYISNFTDVYVSPPEKLSIGVRQIFLNVILLPFMKILML